MTKGARVTAEVAVIIVNFNSGTLLSQCLRCLRAQTRRPERLIVVDNASHDGSADRLEHDYPEVELVRLDHNLGFAAANNLAARRAGQVEWLALLNPDAFPEPQWLERLLAAAVTCPDCASFGARLLDAGDPGRLDGTGDVYHVSGLAWRRDHGRPVAAGASEAGEIFAPARRRRYTAARRFSKRAGSTRIIFVISRTSIWDFGCGCWAMAAGMSRMRWSGMSVRR